MKRHKTILLVLLTAVLLTPAWGIPNPASVYCIEQGYELEIRTDEAGNQYGVCIFPDGSECEEWAFFRGECIYEVEKEYIYEKKAVVDYHGMKFYLHFPIGSRVYFTPTPVSGFANVVIDQTSPDPLDGNAVMIIAGVPTDVYYSPDGETYHLAGTIITDKSGGGTAWPLWLWEDAGGLMKLCNAEPGVFPGFCVTNGMNCN